MRFGVQIAVARGLLRAVDLAAERRCDCFQVHVGNPRGWRVAAPHPDEERRFREAVCARGLHPLVAHAAYLINLATGDAELHRRSVRRAIADLQRAARLGSDRLVVHTGAHGGAGPEAGAKRVARSVKQILREAPRGVRLLLENTAGAGTELGGDWAGIAALLDAIGEPECTGFCFDTCHAHIAGHDLSTEAGVGLTLDAIAATIGLERLFLIHANDAKYAMGSRRDAHWHIGKGTIGLAGFRALVNDARVAGLPCILETPDEKQDARNLRTIRRLVVWRRPGTPPGP
jgi:deoxyribonuclease-4